MRIIAEITEQSHRDLVNEFAKELRIVGFSDEDSDYVWLVHDHELGDEALDEVTWPLADIIDECIEFSAEQFDSPDIASRRLLKLLEEKSDRLRSMIRRYDEDHAHTPDDSK